MCKVLRQQLSTHVCLDAHVPEAHHHENCPAQWKVLMSVAQHNKNAVFESFPSGPRPPPRALPPLPFFPGASSSARVSGRRRPRSPPTSPPVTLPASTTAAPPLGPHPLVDAMAAEVSTPQSQREYNFKDFIFAC
ncbi:hypothetical protein Taro_045665 [Colocasia esculenta]|uniref:Uncharacterized protein n=1 Tax=Colocasia esculenta TaxID=4460 RepID=A0A843WXK5_COLES|nr:hypothetical protein [Colocasia esculenta]